MVCLHKALISILHLFCAMHMAGAGHGAEEEQTHSLPCGHGQTGRQTNTIANLGSITEQVGSDRNAPHLGGGKFGGANKGSRGRAEASGWRERWVELAGRQGSEGSGHFLAWYAVEGAWPILQSHSEVWSLREPSPV